MMIGSLSQTLLELRRRLAEAFGQDVPLILFGSQARGNATPESDADVLALLPDLSPRSLHLAFDLAWEVGFEAGIVISLIPATREEWEGMASPFFSTVRREGIAV